MGRSGLHAVCPHPAETWQSRLGSGSITSGGRMPLRSRDARRCGILAAACWHAACRNPPAWGIERFPPPHAGTWVAGRATDRASLPGHAWPVRPHPPFFYLSRVARSCIQATSGLFGCGTLSWSALLIGGVVRASTHFRTSAWPSTNEKPPARL